MSFQSQTAVLEQREFRKPQFNFLLWSMLALVAIGISAGIYALYAGHHQTLGVTRNVPWGIGISTYAYLAIISTGLCGLAALSHLFGGNNLGLKGNHFAHKYVHFRHAYLPVDGDSCYTESGQHIFKFLNKRMAGINFSTLEHQGITVVLEGDRGVVSGQSSQQNHKTVGCLI